MTTPEPPDHETGSHARRATGAFAGRYKPGRDPGSRPLLGLGAVGWCLLALLCALIGVAATGFDLQFAMQKWISATLGDDAVYIFTITLTYQTLLLEHFGIITALVVAVPMFLDPYDKGRVAPRLVVLLPALALSAWSIVGLTLREITGFRLWDWYALDILALLLVAQVVFAVAIWKVTRSPAILALAIALVVFDGLQTLIGSYTGHYEGFIRMPYLPLIGAVDRTKLFILWHAAMFALLMTWAVPRRRGFRPLGCWFCNYDLTAHNPESPCPECGHAVPGDHPLRLA